MCSTHLTADLRTLGLLEAGEDAAGTGSAAGPAAAVAAAVAAAPVAVAVAAVVVRHSPAEHRLRPQRDTKSIAPLALPFLFDVCFLWVSPHA